MQTILIWLGSGFAFAVGVCFGAWMMSYLNQRDRVAADKTREFWEKQHEQGERLLELREEANRIAVKHLEAVEASVYGRQ